MFNIGDEVRIKTIKELKKECEVRQIPFMEVDEVMIEVDRANFTQEMAKYSEVVGEVTDVYAYGGTLLYRVNVGAESFKFVEWWVDSPIKYVVAKTDSDSVITDGDNIFISSMAIYDVITNAECPLTDVIIYEVLGEVKEKYIDFSLEDV